MLFQMQIKDMSETSVLLEMLRIKGFVVAIDAMGCQKKIAKEIIKKDADYILIVKDNHKDFNRRFFCNSKKSYYKYY